MMDIYAVSFGRYGNVEVEAEGRYEAIKNAVKKLGLDMSMALACAIASVRKLTPSPEKQRMWDSLENN